MNVRCNLLQRFSSLKNDTVSSATKWKSPTSSAHKLNLSNSEKENNNCRLQSNNATKYKNIDDNIRTKSRNLNDSGKIKIKGLRKTRFNQSNTRVERYVDENPNFLVNSNFSNVGQNSEQPMYRLGGGLHGDSGPMAAKLIASKGAEGEGGGPRKPGSKDFKKYRPVIREYHLSNTRFTDSLVHLMMKEYSQMPLEECPEDQLAMWCISRLPNNFFPYTSKRSRFETFDPVIGTIKGIPSQPSTQARKDDEYDYCKFCRPSRCKYCKKARCYHCKQYRYNQTTTYKKLVESKNKKKFREDNISVSSDDSISEEEFDIFFRDVERHVKQNLERQEKFIHGADENYINGLIDNFCTDKWPSNDRKEQMKIDYDLGMDFYHRNKHLIKPKEDESDADTEDESLSDSG